MSDGLNAETILNKLKNLKRDKPFDDWELEEVKQLLDIYHIISQRESHIFDLIYSNHHCDSWEDIFRDYDKNYLKDKATGVKIAIDNILERMTENSEEEGEDNEKIITT
jgi:hypothetical protein